MENLLLLIFGAVNRDLIRTEPERDGLIPINLQLDPGVEAFRGGDTPTSPSFASLGLRKMISHIPLKFQHSHKTIIAFLCSNIVVLRIRLFLLRKSLEVSVLKPLKKPRKFQC